MKQSAFTVVELLVVISTIALLMCIFLPGLQQSRLNAEALLCSSNIKNLTLSLILYDSDNQVFPYGFNSNFFKPPPGGYPGSPTYNRMGWWWFNYIANYSKKKAGADSVLWCPSRHIKDSKLKNNVLCNNYGINQYICKSYEDTQNLKNEFVGTPLSSNNISRQSETLLIVDSGYSMINWWHVTDSPPTQIGNNIEESAYVPGLWINKTRKLWPGQEEDAIYGRHLNKTVNVGFVDNHVSNMKADDLFVQKSGDNYENLYPLWLSR
jgi:prepilin-type processing-associated H-X9-DG protein